VVDPLRLLQVGQCVCEAKVAKDMPSEQPRSPGAESIGAIGFGRNHARDPIPVVNSNSR